MGSPVNLQEQAVVGLGSCSLLQRLNEPLEVGCVELEACGYVRFRALLVGQQPLAKVRGYLGYSSSCFSLSQRASFSFGDCCLLFRAWPEPTVATIDSSSEVMEESPIVEVLRTNDLQEGDFRLVSCTNAPSKLYRRMCPRTS